MPSAAATATTATTATTTGPTGVLGRRSLIHPDTVRTVYGDGIEPGDVLPTGVVLEVSRNDIDGEVRLEMVGANIHYVDYDEAVTVLARVDRAVLDAVSVGAFIAAHPPRLTAVPTLTPDDTTPAAPGEAPTTPAVPEGVPAGAPAPSVHGTGGPGTEPGEGRAGRGGRGSEDARPPRTREVRPSPQAREGKSNKGRLGQYEEDVQHYQGECPIHGVTTFAVHRGGMRAGRQRYIRRCLQCHADYNLEH